MVRSLIQQTKHLSLVWALVWGLLAMALAFLALEASAVPSTQKALSGGEATVGATSRQAFGQPVPGLSPPQQTQFFVGNSFFNRNWVVAPASTRARDGLGPLFNARSCSTCHRLDGRGRPPRQPDEQMVSMLLRLSIPGHDAHAGVVPEPRYGDQLNGLAIPGIEPEGRASITYEEIAGHFADGEPYQLRHPTYTIGDLHYGSLHPDVRVSPRTAPVMIGLGLLEAIPEPVLLALPTPKTGMATAFPDGRIGSGIGRISGR